MDEAPGPAPHRQHKGAAAAISARRPAKRSLGGRDVSLSVTAECIALIEAAAAPIPRHRRERFYERIAELGGLRRRQRERTGARVDAPRPSPPAPRSPYVRRAR